MKQVVNLVRERHWENARWSDYFILVGSDDPEQSFRNAIKEYLLTEDGKKVIKATSEDFNWGDGIMYVPDEVWKKHGIKPLYEGDDVVFSNLVEILVDQDEVLVPNEYYEQEEN